eukprot:CAMPEP_0206149134 /NCGR_PEP_ID=MMETSP1473-20131121/37622_1 /ASSEMBLY_ACC=CAM_ASM_001109 /TAXON_ID=1461547 /ORGANISM="Stichococcus sp, Strain RCC1054" /LENGTH=1096 /DNA_ID=CAMNT_0053546583 /DNA_START=242 /DNA_END=3533 /DNA_ORIENTATION=+
MGLEQALQAQGDAALRQNTSETSDKRSTAAQCTRAERIQKGLKTLTWDPLRVMDGLAHQPRPLEPVTRSASEEKEEGFAVGVEGAKQAGFRFGNVDVSFPVALRLKHGLRARPDLQLQMFTIRGGSFVQSTPSRKASDSHPLAASVIDLATRGAALAFVTLMFPDEAWPWAQRAAVVGVGSSLFLAGRRSAKLHGWHLPRRPSFHVDLSSHRALQQGLAALGHATHETCLAAALMAAALVVLHKADDQAFHTLRCLAMSLTLNAGYAQTARAAATGRLQPGPETERAFRARHKWAARKTAPLLRDMHPTPPLGWLADAQSLLTFASSRGGESIPNNLHPSSIISGLGAGDVGGLNIWGSSAIPDRGRPKPADPDFSLTTIPEEAATLQAFTASPSLLPPAGRRSPAEGAAASMHVAATAKPVRQTGLPVAATADVDIGNESGLRTPDAGLPYPTSMLRTVRSKEEFERALQQQAAAVVAKGGADADDGMADSASESFDARPMPGRASSPALPSVASQPYFAAVPNGSAAAAKAIKPAVSDPEPLAPLYGRADHMKRHDAVLSPGARFQLVLRALYLLLVFAPFLLLGVPLLLIAACIPAQTEPELVEVAPEDPAAVVTVDGVNVGPAASVAVPAPARAPAEPVPPVIAEVLGQGPQAAPRGMALRRAAFNLLLFGCRNSGAAFIKWGQWASSRPDLLPEDLCQILTALQQDAPKHSYYQTRKQIELCFGLPIEAIFESFNEQPIASASIAQVHKAVLKVKGEDVTVAVKVRHPGVVTRITQDFQLLIPLARAASKFRALKGLSLEQSVSQFSNTMTAQADLRVEAAHLRRFLHNFRNDPSTTAPRPIDPWVASGVLVESFEPGESVERFIRNPQPFNTEIVGLGVNAYLHMLLEDSYVHTDLHPGNIFVSIQESKPSSGTEGTIIPAGGASGGSIDSTSSSAINSGCKKRMRMTLLDFGLAEELNPAVRFRFISFLHTISAGDGRRAAGHLLAMGDNDLCPDAEGFTSDMIMLFNKASRVDSPEGINVDTVLKAVLKLARKHEVSINSSYAALVLGVCVIVGFATALDPQVNLMDAATPCLFAQDLFGRVNGNLYS